MPASFPHIFRADKDRLFDKWTVMFGALVSTLAAVSCIISTVLWLNFDVRLMSLCGYADEAKIKQFML